MNNKNFIFDVNESEFAEKIIEQSANNIILVDFWAPWCGPCKKLTPLLEEITQEAGGMISLAKINIDENKQLATQLRIQSIPTVIAFHNKQILDGFQGVLSKAKIIEFIEKISGESFPQNKDEFYKKINELIKNNNFDMAVDELEGFLSENSNDVEAIYLYIDSLSVLERFKDVKKFIESLSDAMISNQKIKKAIDKYKMLESASKEPSLDILISAYKNQPDDINNILKLCDKYFFEKEYEKAFELLLNNYVKLKDKNKNTIKLALLKHFDALGDNHEKTKIYRRKLSSLIFS